MRGRGRFLLVLASVFAVTLGHGIVVTTQAGAGHPGLGVPDPGSHNIRLWMRPPVDGAGLKACLTQSWHEPDPVDFAEPSRGLDWRAGPSADTSCTSPGTSETVQFRIAAADLSQAYDGDHWYAMSADKTNLTSQCPDGWTVHMGKVKIWDDNGDSHGFMIFAHTVVTTGTIWPIKTKFVNGVNYLDWSYGASWAIGNTVRDGPTNGTGDCWTGWHVHEVNNDGGAWDPEPNGYNDDYDNSPAFCNCYNTSDKTNWTRRMTFTMVVP